MKSGIHKICAVILLIVIVLSAFPPVCAAEPTASVVFTATILDRDGYFALLMSISNAKFQGFNFVLRYDPKNIRPVNVIGEETDDFDMLIGKPLSVEGINYFGNLDRQKGLLDFSAFLMPTAFFASPGLEKEFGKMNIGDTPVSILAFKFKRIGNAPVTIELAVKDGDKPYVEGMPMGGMLGIEGHRLPMTVKFKLPGNSGGEYTVPGGPQNTDPDMTPSKRLQNTVVLQIGNNAAAKNGARVPIFPNEKRVAPYVKKNRTMVPLRFVAEQYGAKVDWDASKPKIVKITLGSDVVIMEIGKNTYTQNGVSKSMDTESEILENRTMVPVSFLMQALGYSVTWDGEYRLVIIAPKGEEWQADRDAEKQARDKILQVLSPAFSAFD